MALKNKGKKEVDPSYGVEYINYFGDKDYTGNNDIIFKHQGDYFHTLTKSKAQETIRYIEVIRGLQEQLSKDQSDYDQIKIENNMLYKSISDWITKKETQNILKQCPVKDTLIKKILLDNGYTMKGA
ncbi:MAG: hypothetical protein LBH96_06010 [Candidatus Peribacteria bacterium]|jgi:hypothetical protein|nr:hypothetical protein [Candidatus Peribacteria bacterium]